MLKPTQNTAFSAIINRVLQRFLMTIGLAIVILPSAIYCQQIDGGIPIRVKDLADIEGVRSNQLIGYGLVVGLNRTGDRVQQNIYASQTLQSVLERMGISAQANTMKPENIATVLVTADLPPFIR